METASEIDILIEDPRWNDADLDALARRAVSAVLDHLDLGGGWIVSVLGCDDARIAILNGDFRDKPRPTNVLSWPSEERGAEVPGGIPPRPQPDGDPELGDIAIAYETTSREARDAGIPLSDHTLHLIVHGTLHLLGYDHERDADGDLMEATEIAILGKLGLADPYNRQ